MADLRITNGIAVDASGTRREPIDVVIGGGRILAVGPHLTGPAERTIDASGLLVVPGLVDLHAHFYRDMIGTSVDPDRVCLPYGVTTAVDGGTAGCHTYRGLRRSVIDTARTRVLPFLNVGAAGFATLPAMGELGDPVLMREAEASALARSDAAIRGFKVRLAKSALGSTDPREILHRSLRLAEEVALPLMIHVGHDTSIPIENVLPEMRRGDILTHVFHGGDNGLLDESGRVHRAALAAQQRGVVFDVGHGGGHFDIRVARSAITEGFYPDTISTDAWSGRPGSPPQYALPHLLSLLVGLGLGLGRALDAATRAPAAAVGMDGTGSLQPGSRADLALLRPLDGDFEFVDGFGQVARIDRLLDPRITILNGVVVAEREPAPSFTSPERD